ncbi:hypothetical protein BKA70DRAFT_512702 [Coprinopsis sp. MPI-PUGE-AT-0042]|nr:hypothetical protein BKA70DRAFT_512702 [Coprinopsis sp. MPI-PUGE-AT-0042]
MVCALDLSLLNQELPDLSSSVALKYSSRLHTNYIPSQPEVDEIRAFSSAITSKSAQVASEITLLQAKLAKLQNRQTFLDDAAAPFKALISPFRRFPPELMQYIFMTCLPESRNAVMHCSEAPVLLGRVCSEWRRIALNTPALWSSLHIVPPNFNADASSLNKVRFQRKRDVVEMWLRRSGACPLSLSFVWFGSDGVEETALCGELLGLLVPLSKRWKKVEFQMPLRMCRAFAALSADDVPLLESINLTDNRSNYEDFDPTPPAVSSNNLPLVSWPEHLQFVASAPSLKSLNLTFFTGALRIPPTLAWDQLTSLYLEANVSFFFADCRDMLQTLERCTSLQSCTLKLPLSVTAAGIPPHPLSATLSDGNSGGGKDKWMIDYPITLPELTSLCVDGDQNLKSTFHMTSVLANIRAPKLTELSIFGRSSRPGHFESDDDDEDDDESISDGGAVEGLDLNLPEPSSSPHSTPSSQADLLLPLAPPPPPPPPLHPAAMPPYPWTEPSFPAQTHLHEPLYGLKSLLLNSLCTLEKLRLESITIFEKELVGCMKLMPGLTELVLRDYGARIGFSPVVASRRGGGKGGKGKGKVCVEDRILQALTVERGWNSLALDSGGQGEDDDGEEGKGMQSMPASPATSSWTMVEDGDDTSLRSPSPLSTRHEEEGHTGELVKARRSGRQYQRQQEPLLPSLMDFEFAASFGSQETFCRFVESRFLPDPVPLEVEPSSSLDGGDSSSQAEECSASAVDSSLPLLAAASVEGTLPSIQPVNDNTFGSPSPTTTSTDLPPLPEVSIARLRSVKCTFTAQERPDVKARFKRMEELGLDMAGVVFRAPSPDECVPSPWMGVEGVV